MRGEELSGEFEAKNPAGRRLSFGRLVPIAILAAGLVVFFAFDLGHYLSLDALKQNRKLLMAWVEGYGAAAAIGYMAIYAVVIAFSLPAGAILTITGGFLFGPLIGASLTVVAATLGATALFLAARHAFADYLRDKAGPAVRKMEDGFNEDAFNYLLVLRLIPLFPFWLVNLVPALLGVGLGNFVVATAIGIVPGTIVYALLGDGLGAVIEAGGALDLAIVFEPRFLAPLIGLAVLALLPVLYKKYKANKA
jgi:uncharacterized membrane protein YdjX (TVP38/TMEM64 family)